MKRFLLIAGVVLNLFAAAQPAIKIDCPSITFHDSTTGQADTSTMGSHANITFRLINQGNVSYTSNFINIRYEVRDDSVQGTLYSSRVFAVQMGTATITPNQTVTVAFQDTIQPSAYKQAGNTVVIWPLGTYMTNDSCYLEGVWINDAPTGIPESKLTNNLVYPNPVRDQLTIRYANSCSLFLRDIYGRVLREERYQPQQRTLRVEELPAGVYFLELRDHEKSFYSKFIKE